MLRHLLILFSSITVFTSYGQLKFTEHHRSINLAPDSASRSVSFTFTAESDVTLSHIKESCSCTTSQLLGKKRSWKTGETGEIEITLDATLLHGTSTKTVTVHTETHPAINLSIEAILPVAYEATPRTQRWKVGAEKEPKDYIITIGAAFRFEFTEIIPNQSSFEYTFTPSPSNKLGEPRSYTLTVTPNTTEKKQICAFRLYTNSEIERYKSFNLLAMIL